MKERENGFVGTGTGDGGAVAAQGFQGRAPLPSAPTPIRSPFMI